MAEKLFKKLYRTPLILPNPMALCRDNDGKVYIADTGGNRILRYTSAGVLDTAFDNTMKAVCNGSSCKISCLAYALVYYEAVYWGGDSAYNSAQNCSCGT